MRAHHAVGATRSWRRRHAAYPYQHGRPRATYVGRPRRVVALWQHHASAALGALDDQEADYLGIHLRVPAGVFLPAPMLQMLGRGVIAEVRAGVRVLDMGIGSELNTVLAAPNSGQMMAADVNPAAVIATATSGGSSLASATASAPRGVAQRHHVRRCPRRRPVQLPRSSQRAG